MQLILACCFSYVIPTDIRFYICRSDVIPTDNSFMHAEVIKGCKLIKVYFVRALVFTSAAQECA